MYRRSRRYITGRSDLCWTGIMPQKRICFWKIHCLSFLCICGREETRCRLFSSGPDSQIKTIHDNYLRLIHSAKDHVYIQTPYFIPDESILDALKIASRSGIDVRIMVPCKPDHPFVYWATYSYIGDMVAAGAKCYVYNNGFLHAKTLSVDGMVACVGTANMDIRSFGLNFEVNAVIYSERTVQRLESAFENDMTRCTHVTRKVYDERSLVIKAKEQFSRLLSPLL